MKNFIMAILMFILGNLVTWFVIKKTNREIIDKDVFEIIDKDVFDELISECVDRDIEIESLKYRLSQEEDKRIQTEIDFETYRLENLGMNVIKLNRREN